MSRCCVRAKCRALYYVVHVTQPTTVYTPTTATTTTNLHRIRARLLSRPSCCLCLHHTAFFCRLKQRFGFNKFKLTHLSICVYAQSNQRASFIMQQSKEVSQYKLAVCVCVWSIFLITINYSFDAVYVRCPPLPLIVPAKTVA